MCFVGVMLIPIVYYIIIPLWLCKTWIPRIQFWLGLFMYVFCGPFLNIAVLLYASFYMDSFGWGKTRKVISEEETGEKCESELQRLEKGDVESKEKSEGSSSSETGASATPSRDCADEERQIGMGR